MKRILTKLFIALALRIWKHVDTPEIGIHAKVIVFPRRRRDNAEAFIQIYDGESCCLCIRKMQAGLAEPMCHAVATMSLPEMRANVYLQMKEEAA